MYKIFHIAIILVILINLNESKIFIPGYDVVYKNITFAITNKSFTAEAFNADNPEICTWGDHKFGVNEIYRPIGDCKTIKCIEPGKVEIINCGSVAFDYCTSIGMDMSKQHPHCCHRLSCTNMYGDKFIYNPLSPGEGDIIP